ncbi:hypothetical protein [Extensimonas vulgaris]|uniref:hypothetical protein n=1 Tax=Extensimonas vulgaris TaxID=1031594 RepID=UPI0011BEB3D7|nr:hypothetical protein [Extensimonas vulgaris]TXD17328.1 hypothetical protein FUT63_00850 [Extensimonas vulgaris]
MAAHGRQSKAKLAIVRLPANITVAIAASTTPLPAPLPADKRLMRKTLSMLAGRNANGNLFVRWRMSQANQPSPKRMERWIAQRCENFLQPS